MTCAEEYVSDIQKKDDAEEIHSSLNMEGGLAMFPIRSFVSLNEMKWKIFCFDDQYNYLFDRTGSIGDAANEVKVSVTRGIVYRSLFLCTTTDKLPKLTSDKTYWDLDAYVLQLPLVDPMAMLVSRGNEKDGALRVAVASAPVRVILAPRASKIILQKGSQTASDITVNSVTFADAASSVSYVHIEPRYCGEYEDLPVVIRETYQHVPQEDVCYMLPDMYAGTFGVNVTLHITHPISGEQDMRITVPIGLALNVGNGKTYYIEMSTNANEEAVVTWTARVASKTPKLTAQDLWGKNTSTVLNCFDKVDMDILRAQECSKFSESDIQAQRLYVHTYSSNGQRKCSIIPRYPFSGITPDRYGVYIDLGESITVLVMNHHSALYPYDPYQLNGVEYEGYEAADNIDYVVKVNKEARQGMADKLLEDFNSSTTPFVCLSGDFNEPSWLDWTEDALSTGLTFYVVQWPITRSLWEGGVKSDAYRTIHPDPVTHPGFTWTSYPDEKDAKDRLDLTLYTLSPNTDMKSYRVIGGNTEASNIALPNWGPFEEVFDHRGLRTEFVFTK